MSKVIMAAGESVPEGRYHGDSTTDGLHTRRWGKGGRGWEGEG